MNQFKKRVALGVCTRARPEGLRKLLDSYLNLDIPAGIIPVYIIVENDEKTHSISIVDAFRNRTNCEVHYACESKLGIPFARNALLDLAISNDCDMLTMVDDDEVVDSKWLVEIYEEFTKRNLQLCGGPVRIQSTNSQKIIEQIIWKGLSFRFAKIEKKANVKHKKNKDYRVTVVTNNWLCCLKFVIENNLRFDESLGFSGGSDTRFYKKFISSGGRSGWAPYAIVYEYWPPSRLTIGYQFERGRDQSISNFRNKYKRVDFFILVSSLFLILYKIISTIIMFFTMFFDGGKSSVIFLRTAGFAYGRALALFGFKSNHYAKIKRFF